MSVPSRRVFLQSESFIYVLYIVAFALFIHGLRGLTGPTHRGARQPHRRRRHGDRRDRDAAQPRRGQLGADRARRRARHRRRRARGAPGEDDRDAADGRAVQRRRRRRRGPDRVGGVPQQRLHLRLAHDPHRAVPASRAASRSSPAGLPTYVAIFSLFAAIVGSISFWGSNIAFGKLQELLPGRPITLGRRAAARSTACC